MKRFDTAQEAFEHYYKFISKNGIELENTLFIQNEGFIISNPLNNEIKTKYRNWKKDYAEYEWQWYLSKNNNVSEIKKKAKIWDTMHSGNDLVNSNYGYQWARGNQIDYIVNELKRNPNSRRAVISIYDGKENDLYEFDTPCTLSIIFNITNNKLNMTVIMRSNDLWFGFCNDQYCFSNLLNKISNELNIEVGWYYHFANNFHIYSNKLNKNIIFND